MKESYSNQEKFISSLLIFVFIFIIIVIAVLALHYSGILNLKNESSDTTVTDSTAESFATYPSDFSSSDSLQTTSQTTEETTVSTKYLPASELLFPLSWRLPLYVQLLSSVQGLYLRLFLLWKWWWEEYM